MNQQNHREQEGSVKTGRGTLYRVAWAVVFGLLGFFVNFQDIQLLAGPAFKISILAGLFFPLVITLAWGWRYGLLAALAGGCQSMWWLWRTDGWGLFYAVPVFTLWMVWHGWWADRRRVKTAWYTSPFIVEIPFRIVVELGFYTIFRWLVSFNPPPWNPAVSWAHVSLVWVNTVVIKHVVTGYILLLAAYVTLNLGGVRRFFRLPRRAGQHDVTAIYATALLAGFLFWLVDAFMAWTVFNDQAVSFWEQAVIHVKPRCMGIRVLVFVFAVAGATVFARLAYVRAGLTQRLDHLNRVLAAIRDVNQLITHEKNRDRLLEEACRLLVHTRGFFSAWLAVVDSSGSVQKTFHSGFEGRFLSMEEALSMSVLPDCARTALKEPGVHVMDPARQCLGCSLSDEYDGCAALTMQLVHEGRVYGFVSVAVPPPYAWDKQEHELFAEVCNDLAYALWSLEVDAARGLLEEKYAAVLDSTSDAVIATDLEGRIMLFNAGAERLLECSASEVLGTSIRLFCPEELGDEQSRMLQELLTSGQVQRIETQRVTAKGRLIPVEISLDVRVDEHGKPAGYTGILRDISERKRIEALAQQSQRRYRVIFEGSRDGIVMVDALGHFLDANQAYCDMLGYSLEELRALKDFYSITPERWRQWEAEEIVAKRLLEQGYSGVYEKEYIRKDGSVFPVELQSYTVRDADGGVEYLWGIARDITARQTAETALRESEERMDLILRSAELGTWDWNVQTGEVVFNERWAAMLGYELEEIAPHADSWAALVHPDDMPHVQEVLQAHLRGESDVYETEHRMKHKSGRWVWVLDKGAVIERNEAGEPIRACGTHLEITERKRMEEQQRLHSLVLSQIADFVTVTDLEGNITYVNDAVCRILGRTRDELLGQAVTAYGNPAESRITQDEILDRTLQGGWRGEVVNVTADGDSIFLDCRTRQVLDELGDVVALCGISTDITERKKAEEALVAAKEAAEAADRAKSAFLANMSHELRTPLNPIMGFTDLVLADADLSDEHQSFLRIIKQRSRDLLQLLSDILDIAKVEANRVVIRPEAVDVREIVQDVMAMFKHQATSKGVALNVGISEDFPFCLMVDPARLRQILLNLVGNAVKFTDQGQVAVLVDWREDDPSCPLGTGRLTVEVKDTGCGIKPEMQAHIFESFEQADNSSTRQYGGAGLGLAICKRLAELMGGTIGVKSAPGEGAQFTVTLCAAHEKTDAEEGDLDPAAATSGSEPEETLRVLLVEDDEASLELTRRMLEREGHVVTCVTTGVEAVEQGLAGDYHLILMDVKLPEMDGLEATQRLREKGCPVPIVAMTAFAFAEDRKACLAAGMNDWMTKPVTPEALEQAIAGIAQREDDTRKL